MSIPEPLVAADLADVLAIYEEAFPANERVPTAVLAAELGRSRTCLVLRSEGRVVAFASLIPLAEDTHFLEYLAVRSGARGGGYGARMVEQIRTLGVAVLFEVEDPAEPGLTTDEVRSRERRIAFYAANGGAPAPFGLCFHPPSFDGSPTARMVVHALDAPGRWTLADVLDRLATAAAVSYATAGDAVTAPGGPAASAEPRRSAG
ncbi:Acetyltransferase (GNAT) domain-containing protein [Blastococcus aurantiacus]|uniref:Acetyltransferase (GNAT) domain-containing protein n=1 Tax=Blastococcus aurantiacus TaxID=1550231 RepID=A0A1G7HNQ7_9ACTN|nr:GNAT family N-acetyltransferase [Blastococcus aurantiacus]SDF01649.1 Acetyltransferase (GNAT) domain-containing protein [Blastococcus aurantiacus]